ncbi:hypothetical protein ACFSGX_15540 [Sphingomonas arantia]|uniref:DUF2188 domain-containing protein n=1 Tax=Sphingomonas arantia TaxID=1460676 RepID=A0ABW4TZR7_9SPHN
MSSAPTPTPDISGLVLYVGQDRAGHWLVQDNNSRIEGRFTCYASALSFAEAERDIYHATVKITNRPLVPLISFGPAGPGEYALPRAA